MPFFYTHMGGHPHSRRVPAQKLERGVAAGAKRAAGALCDLSPRFARRLIICPQLTNSRNDDCSGLGRFWQKGARGWLTGAVLSLPLFFGASGATGWSPINSQPDRPRRGRSFTPGVPGVSREELDGRASAFA
jgi:hypothetical protein